MKASFEEKVQEEDPLRKLVQAFESGEEQLDFGGREGRRYRKRTYLDNTPVKEETDDDDGGTDYQGLSIEKSEEVGERYLKAWRIRFLSGKCIPVLERALEYDHQFVDAICYREGFTAPNCIKALRARRERIERARKRSKKTRFKDSDEQKPRKPKGGFSSF